MLFRSRLIARLLTCGLTFVLVQPISFGNRPVNAAAVELSKLVQKYVTPDGTHTLHFSKYNPDAAPTVEQRPLPESSVFKLRGLSSVAAPCELRG